jgi:ferric-dicitrate binding protein FerR (iron transport regulator)
MNRTSLALSIAIPASSAARGPLAASPMRDGGPSRSSRRSRIGGLAIALATCGIVAFVGWILVTGVLDLETSAAAPSVAAPACDDSSCAARFAPASSPLPHEWRWERKKVEFDHMYRK